jgi:UDP-2-acetamido-3-amino-2,3-dideoxy-glucuronate N-acetyltransferase
MGRLYAICETDPARLASFATQYPDARPFGSFQDMLRDKAIDGVVLATPAEHHYRMAMQAIRAGKDVFVEKPLALDAMEGSDLIEEAEAYHRVLMVGHLLRYHPAVLKIQELVADGTLGKIEYIYSNRLSMGKIRAEENALWSFAPHDISVILALMRRQPVQVSATGGAYLQPNIADVTVSHLLFDNGARAHIFVSWLHPYKEQRLVVIGTRQMAVFEDSKPANKLVIFDKHIEWKNGALEAGKCEGVPLDFPSYEPLRQECEHFTHCIAGRQKPVTSGEEGLRVLQVLQSCQRSLQMNGEPVQMNQLAARKMAAL